MLLLQLANLGLMELARIHTHGLHPLRIDILDGQIRANVLFIDQRPHSAHAKESPLILLGRTQILDLKILIPRRANGLDVMERTARPDGIDPSRLVVLIPRATLLHPDRVAHPLLAVLVERVRDILLGRQTRDVLALDLFDDLKRVVADVHERTHHAAVLHWPVGPDEGQEVGEAGDREAQVSLRADFPFVGQVDPVLAYDWEARAVGHVEPGGAHDRVDFHARAIFADYTCFVDLHNFCEVHVDIGFLDRSVKEDLLD